MKGCRTDLCPDCGTRLNLDINHKEYFNWDTIIVEFPVMIEYNNVFYTTIQCSSCKNLWTKPQVLDYWAEFLRKEVVN